MRQQNTIFVALVLAAAISVSGQTVAAQQQQKTSENTPFLQKFFENRPDADLNKDGVLTLEEAQKVRDQQKPRGDRPGPKAPTEADVSYGDAERNVLDFWKADSTGPAPLFVWIHGGGFRAGDKKSIPASLLLPCLEAGISCAAINYRLTDTAPYPAQMHDSARAIQFLRSKADQWNIDPERFAAGGGSAGSGISQWLAFHDDMADPKSADPIARQSTRLTCAIPINMQSTYDPRQIKEIVPGNAYDHPALHTFFDRPEGWNWDTGEIDAALDALLKDASPITHLTADDPPIYLIHSEKAATPGNIHHPNFGKHLEEAMNNLKIECNRHLDSDYDSTAASHADMVEFLKKHFKIKKSKK